MSTKSYDSRVLTGDVEDNGILMYIPQATEDTQTDMFYESLTSYEQEHNRHRKYYCDFCESGKASMKKGKYYNGISALRIHIKTRSHINAFNAHYNTRINKEKQKSTIFTTSVLNTNKLTKRVNTLCDVYVGIKRDISVLMSNKYKIGEIYDYKETSKRRMRELSEENKKLFEMNRGLRKLAEDNMKEIESLAIKEHYNKVALEKLKNKMETMSKDYDEIKKVLMKKDE